MTSGEQFQGVVEIFTYLRPARAEAPFPRQFPFSAGAYMLCDELRQFVLHCTGFASKINLRLVCMAVILCVC